MLRTALKSLFARKLRLLLTATAIMLGTAFITGTLVLTDTSTQLFDDQFAQATAGVDVIVREAAEFGAAMGVEVERNPVPAEVLASIRATPGVAEAEGTVRGSALLVVDGEPAIPGGASVGMSWADEPYNPFRIATGRPPRTDDEVVIDRATATAAGIEAGDAVDLSLADGSHPVTVVGTADFGDAPGIPDTTVALIESRAAQELFGLGDGWSEVQVVADGIGADALSERLESALDSAWEVSTSRDVAAASAAAAQEQLLYLKIMLLVLAATSLVVGGFMIANTFAIVVAQRTREFATLRALGASGRQLTGSVLIEAVIVGTVASAAGVLLGIGAAAGLRSVASAFGVVVPDGPLAIEGRTLLVGLAVGLVVTVGSALAPARRAARIAPVVAMRDSAPAARPVSRRRVIVGGATLGLALVVLGSAAASGNVRLAGAGAVAALAATAVLAPAFAGRLADTAGRGIRYGGLVPRLARTNLRRTERRTAATAMALAVGLAVVTFMTVVATSAKAAIESSVDDVIEAELVVQSSRNEMLGGLSPHVYHHASEVDGIAAASRLRFGHWEFNGATKALTAVDPQTLPEVADVGMVAGELAALAGGGIVLSEDIAAGHGVRVGDRLPMTFAGTGDQGLEVVGIFDEDDVWAMSTGYLISLDTFAENFTEDVDATVFLRLAEGTDAAAVTSAVEDVLVDYPTAEVYDQADAIAERTRMLDSMLGLVTVLLLLAVLVALLGITNALALSIVERTREVGMLRAIGMTRRQLSWMVRTEAALTATAGAVTGAVLGVVVGAAVVQALGSTAAIPFSVPVWQLAGYVAVATLGGVLAGLLPGRRAARMDVLGAIATQ